MTNSVKNVCVYSSASNFLHEIYYKEAAKLGELMGKEKFNLVYGGGTLGAMWENAKNVKAFGGKVIGVLPKMLNDIGVGNNFCDELIITKGMRERKDKMDKLSDACVAISGGFGTLEELSEMIVQKQLGYNDKAIVILNTNGFYDNLLKFFDDIILQHFANEEVRDIIYVAKKPSDVVEYLKNYEPKHFDVYFKLKLDKKILPENS